jgi:hypothetical protein
MHQQKTPPRDDELPNSSEAVGNRVFQVTLPPPSIPALSLPTSPRLCATTPTASNGSETQNRTSLALPSPSPTTARSGATSPSTPKDLQLSPAQRRQKIIDEIRSSERIYVEFLNAAVVLFLVPLRKALDPESSPVVKSGDATATAPILSIEEITCIFQNIEQILHLHTVCVLHHHHHLLYCAMRQCFDVANEGG